MTKKNKKSSKTKSGTLTDEDIHLSNTSNEGQSDGVPNTDNDALITKDVVPNTKEIHDSSKENTSSSSLQSIPLKDSINQKVTDKKRQIMKARMKERVQQFVKPHLKRAYQME